MAERTCRISGCDRPHLARDRCHKHYQQWWKDNRSATKTPLHRLSRVDLLQQKAICAVCGPVEIALRKWGPACKIARRAQRRLGSTRRPGSSRRKGQPGYRLTSAEREMLLVRQNYACAVCGRDSRRLVVDHDHATGQVRGLLCHHCNVGLGWFGDDAVILERAFRYVAPERKEVPPPK